MRDFVYIGTAPVEEDCVQVDKNADYLIPMKKECESYIELLTRKFGEPPCNAHYGIKRENHDFGAYYEVVVWFDDENEDEVNFAFFVEGNQPRTWDDDAYVSYKDVI
jgi:hypothetical protein